MAVDIQALAVGAAGVLTAVGAVLTGMQTGRNSRVKDRQTYETQLEDFRLKREAALEIASKERIEAIASDAVAARARLRETEAEHYREIQAKYTEIRVLQYDRQRGWDLARYHFNALGGVVHILLNIIQASVREPEDNELLKRVIVNSESRLKSMDLPKSLEEPIPDTGA